MTAVALTGKAWSQLELSSRADGLDIIGNLHACQTAEAAVVRVTEAMQAQLPDGCYLELEQLGQS